MPAFSYTAINGEGRSVDGTIEAESMRLARTQLRGQKLIPVDVVPLSNDAQGPWRRGLHGRRAFRRAQLAVWTRQLAGLLGAGLPIERALAALSHEAETKAQRELMASVRAEVNSGTTLASSMSNFRHEFGAIYIAVIDAGEQSGQLDKVLEKLADELDEQNEMRAKVLGAALYPMIVSVVALAIVLFLLGYVVPQIAVVFAGSKKALPMLTQVMLGLSACVRNYGVLGCAALVLAVFGFRLALRRAEFAARVDAWILRVPMLGRMSRSYNTARFSSTMAMLVTSGVPILKALQAAAETLSNRSMKAQAMRAHALVREGAALAKSLEGGNGFPAMLFMFIRLGEHTGRLPEMLNRASLQIRRDVQRRALQIATLLEPLLIVFMGAVVMLIVLSIMLPIIQLNQLVR